MVQRDPDPSPDHAAATPPSVAPVGDDDHVLGLPDAPLTLIVYGSYPCHFTRAVLPVVRDVRERLGDELRYAYRHFPVPAVHAPAQAAAAQGMFWPMHDLLFANQRQLEVPDLLRYTHLLGLDAHRLQRDLVEHRYATRVVADVASGRAAGVAGTPALFVNGVRYDGIHETDVLAEALLTTGGLA